MQNKAVLSTAFLILIGLAVLAPYMAILFIGENYYGSL